MNFEEFKNAYFNGDSDLALRALVNEAIGLEYKLTGSSKSHRKILCSMDANLTNTYKEYWREAVYIANGDENVYKDLKEKLLSTNVIGHELKISNYSTKGMKYMLPMSLALVVLFWIFAGRAGLFEFLITGICCVPFIAVILCYSIITTKVTNSIKNLNFFIVEDQVIDKIYKPGNADNFAKYYFIFKNYGKYSLTLHKEETYNSITNGQSCYLIIPANSKKIRFVYNSQIWRISEKDFSFNNGIYTPYKKTEK